MGRASEKYLEQITGYYHNKDGITYKGKTYTDYGDNDGYTEYSLVDCPICGKKMLQEYEKETTPGFRSSSTCILDRMCDCDLDSYYKEHNKHIIICSNK